MKITPKEINVFKEDFIAAVKGLEKKYGVEIALENIRYTPDEKFEGKMNSNKSGSKEDSRRNLPGRIKIFPFVRGDTGHVQTDLPRGRPEYLPVGRASDECQKKYFCGHKTSG